MPQAIHLDIPKPCHENWQQMTPNEQGRHCMSCQKTVVDFTMMSDKEVVNYFNKSTSQVCGRFANDQLQRDLAIPSEKKKLSWGYFWSVLITGLLISGKSYSQGEPAVKKVKPVEMRPDEPRNLIILGEMISLKIKPAVDLVTMWGMVFDKQTGKPLRGVNIVHQQTGKSIVSDKSGAFSLKKIQKKKTQITISCPGYETQVKELTPAMDWKKVNISLQPTKVIEEVVTKGDVEVKTSLCLGTIQPARLELRGLASQSKIFAPVTGRIYDSATGQPLSGASVRIQGESTGTIADPSGNFNLNIKGRNEVILEVSSVGYKTQTKTFNTVNTGEPLSFALTPNADELKGVEVIGYDSQCHTAMVGGITSTYRVSKTEKIKRKINDWVPAILKKDVQVYPNPVVKGTSVNVVLRLPKTGEYKGELIAANGQVVSVRSIQVTSAEQRITIPTETAWSAGVYWLRIVHPQLNKVYQNKVVVQ